MSTAHQPLLTINIPGRAVSANARLGYSRHTGAKYLTPAARAWKEAVAEHAWFAAREAHLNEIEARLPLRIVIHVYGTRADADNLAKLILDGLKEGIHVDDRHYKHVEMHATAKGMKQPRTVIEVYEAEAEAA